MTDLVGGGYAPGNYMCRCLRCDVQFTGDKRAIRCADCARIVLEERARAAVQALPEQDTLSAVSTAFAAAEIAALRARVKELEARALFDAAKRANDPESAKRLGNAAYNTCVKAEGA